MSSEIVDRNEDENGNKLSYDKEKAVDQAKLSILKRTDYTTPLTRKLNNQPRIYANIKGIDQDYDMDSFIFSKPKTKDDLFQESQERVIQHIETIIQSQNDSFHDSFREIDEMSQENEEHLERIEKYLEKLKSKIMKKRQSQQKPKIIELPIPPKPKPKPTKPNSHNQRADSLMQLNQKQFK